MARSHHVPNRFSVGTSACCTRLLAPLAGCALVHSFAMTGAAYETLKVLRWLVLVPSV
jgi:hypothetical protein